MTNISIKELRQKTGLSQSKFAAKFNIAPINISHWETGVSTPPPYVIFMMEKIINLEEKVEFLENNF